VGWRKRITLDGAQVGSTLSNFPVLIRITDAALQARAAANASDISFVASNGTTLLDFEIERYVASTGTLVAWVRIPSLSAGADTELFVRYGDARPDRSNATGVWGAGYHSVWHLGQNPAAGGAGDMRDSTGRAHGTAHATMNGADSVVAICGRGIDFDGTDDEITFTNTFTGTGPSTLSAWVDQRVDTDGASDTVLSIGNGVQSQNRYLFAASSTTNNVVGGFFANNVDSAVSIEGAGWKYVAWVWDGTASSFFVDGALVSGPTAHTGANTTGAAGAIGNGTWAGRFLRGQLDEVRLQSVVRSAAWIQVEYANQSASSTFLKALGPEEG
jgi:hypothetical protein